MKWFSNLKIARKLTLTFGLVMAMMAGLGVFAIIQFSKLYEPTKAITSDSLPSIRVLGQISTDAGGLRRAELGYLLATAPDLKQTYLKSGKSRDKEINDAITEYGKTVTSEQERRLYKE